MCGTWTKAIAPLEKDLSLGNVTQRERAALEFVISAHSLNLLPLPPQMRWDIQFSSFLCCTTFQRILACLLSFLLLTPDLQVLL